MNKDMAQELQKKIATEAIAMVRLFGEGIDTQGYRQTVSLIGKAWALPKAVTGEQLELIQREMEVIRQAKEGECTDQVPKEKDILCNWTGMETLEALEDLFETSLHLDSYAERKAMFDMAATLMECQNFLDWIEKTPAERELPEAVAV